ncbi:MAG TPA: peptidyl-prolyl cis-trans isomerase [Bdellovibrionales bacterium]|nr:peptidyl-prolyl cis-trans isomerase [Bdellovibrionales bacterium]
MNEMKRSKNEGKALVFCLMAIVSIALSGCFLSQERAVLNRPILFINDTEITTQQFSEKLASRLKYFDALQAKDSSTLVRAKNETVQAFILETIAKDFAKKNGLTISDAELDAEVQKIRSRYPDDFAFRRSLADERMTFDRWKEDLSFTLLQRKIFTKISEKTPEPTEAELKDYYEKNKPLFQTAARVRLRQVVLEREDDAKRILEEISSGKDIGALAKKFSVAPEAENNGDTGWIEKGSLDVFDQAFKMSVGSRSKILQSPYGYHIYEVLKKEPEGRLSFPEAKAKIRAQLIERREQATFSAWLQEQVRKTSVKKNDALINAITVTTRES